MNKTEDDIYKESAPYLYEILKDRYVNKEGSKKIKKIIKKNVTVIGGDGITTTGNVTIGNVKGQLSIPGIKMNDNEVNWKELRDNLIKFRNETRKQNIPEDKQKKIDEDLNVAIEEAHKGVLFDELYKLKDTLYDVGFNNNDTVVFEKVSFAIGNVAGDNRQKAIKYIEELKTIVSRLPERDRITIDGDINRILKELKRDLSE